MKKIRGDPVRFIVSLKEVKKYGPSPLGQLKKNPEAKVLFPKKLKEVKSNDLLRRSIPSRCKGLRFTSPKFCLLIPSY